MAVYTIKDLEKLSGVKAHTLRTWEKRYGIIKPKRTETNIRYYLDHDLKQILSIAFLNKNGIKISKIAKLTDDEIHKKVAELSEVSEVFEDQLDALTLSLIEMNEYKFDRIFQANIDQKGFKQTMIEIIYPLLDKLSLMWMIESISKVHEYFVINIIKRKTMAAIDALPMVKRKNVRSFVIYLPSGESHELSLLFLHYVIKELGFPITNLGKGIGVKELHDVYKILKPDYFLTLVNDSYQNNLSKYVNYIKDNFNQTHLIISGLQVTKQSLRGHENLTILNGVKDIMDFLEKRRPDEYKLNIA